MTDTVNVPQEMIDAVMKVAVGVDEYGSEVFPGPSVAAELARVVIEALKQDPSWVIEQARRQAAQTGMIDTDNVPLNCRQRLAAEGKAYPKLSCSFCGSMSPNWQACDALLAAAPASDELLEKMSAENTRLKAALSAAISADNVLSRAVWAEAELDKIATWLWEQGHQLGREVVADTAIVNLARLRDLSAHPAPASDELLEADLAHLREWLEAERDGRAKYTGTIRREAAFEQALRIVSKLTKHKGPQS